MTLRFVQITDHHLAAGDLLWGYSTHHALRMVLRHVAAHAGPLDLLVSTGDLVDQGSDEEYRVFRELVGSRPGEAFPGPMLAYGEGLSGVPLYVLPGNHDVRPVLLRSLFPASAPAERLHGWFEHGGVRFVCVDWGPANKATSTPALWPFLDEALDTQLPKLFLMHHHVTPMGFPRLDTLIADDVAAFAARITGCGVLAILSGHTHATFEHEFAGVPVYGLRSTCFQLASDNDGGLLRCLLPPHYRIVTLEDGVLTTTIVEVPL